MYQLADSFLYATRRMTSMNKWLADRIREVEESIHAFERDVATLEYLQIGWRPPEGGWSIAQVVEHLIITDESYLAEFDRILARAPRNATTEEWRPSLIGGFLTRSQRPDSKQRMKSPAVWRPAPEARADVVAEYIKVRRHLVDIMQRADGVDLRRTKLSSPAAKFIRLNLGDAFMTLVVHTQRHLAQIQRIRSHAGFPPA
jgi:hypothetical protein